MAPASMDDPEFLQRLSAGDRPAFEQIFREYNAGMVRLATAILKNRASAEEVTQDAWLSVLTHIGQFEGRSPLAGWIFTILANMARRRAARDGRVVRFDDDGSPDPLGEAFDRQGRWKQPPELHAALTAEQIVSDRDMIEQVERVIAELPAAQRAVLILRGQSGMDAAEVCRVLGITEVNMRVLLHRARMSLRSRLGAVLE